MLHGGEAPCPCGNIDISIRWYADCESPFPLSLSLSPLLPFVWEIKHRHKQSSNRFEVNAVCVSGETCARIEKKKKKKNVSPQLFARRKSIKLSMQISLPLARRYIQINPFPIKFRSISLSTSIISYRRDFKTDFHFAFLSVQITLADLPPPSLFVPPYPSPSTFFIHGPAR